MGEAVATVETKEGYGRQCARLVPPQLAHMMIRDAASAAVKNVAKCKPYQIELPATVRVQFGSKQIADSRSYAKAKRVDDLTWEAQIESALEMVRF